MCAVWVQVGLKSVFKFHYHDKTEHTYTCIHVKSYSITYLVGAADEREAVPAVLAVRQVDHSAHRSQAHQVHVLVQLALAAATLQGPRLSAATCNVRCQVTH